MKIEERRSEITEQITRFANKIKEGETQFLAQLLVHYRHAHYLHVISVPSGKATFYYGVLTYVETQEDALRCLHRDPNEKYEMIAVYANEMVYLTAPQIWGVETSDILPAGTTTLARVLEEAKENTKSVLFPTYLSKLAATNNLTVPIPDYDVTQVARGHVIRGTKPSVELSFTIHNQDILKALVNGVSIEQVCNDMLERHKDYYMGALGLLSAIKAKMEAGNLTAPWELVLANAIRNCSEKNISVTFNGNVSSRVVQMDGKVLQEMLISGDPIRFSSCDYRYNPNSTTLTCKDIIEVSIAGETIYKKEGEEK